MTQTQRAVEIVVQISHKAEADLISVGREGADRSDPRPPIDSPIRPSVDDIDIAVVADEQAFGLQEAVRDAACWHETGLCPNEGLREDAGITEESVIGVDEGHCNRGSAWSVVGESDGIGIPRCAWREPWLIESRS